MKYIQDEKTEHLTSELSNLFTERDGLQEEIRSN